MNVQPPSHHRRYPLFWVISLSLIFQLTQVSNAQYGGRSYRDALKDQVGPRGRSYDRTSGSSSYQYNNVSGRGLRSAAANRNFTGLTPDRNGFVTLTAANRPRLTSLAGNRLRQYAKNNPDSNIAKKINAVFSGDQNASVRFRVTVVNRAISGIEFDNAGSTEQFTIPKNTNPPKDAVPTRQFKPNPTAKRHDDVRTHSGLTPDALGFVVLDAKNYVKLTPNAATMLKNYAKVNPDTPAGKAIPNLLKGNVDTPSVRFKPLVTSAQGVFYIKKILVDESHTKQQIKQKDAVIETGKINPGPAVTNYQRSFNIGKSVNIGEFTYTAMTLKPGVQTTIPFGNKQVSFNQKTMGNLTIIVQTPKGKAVNPIEATYHYQMKGNAITNFAIQTGRPKINANHHGTQKITRPNDYSLNHGNKIFVVVPKPFQAQNTFEVDVYDPANFPFVGQVNTALGIK